MILQEGWMSETNDDTSVRCQDESVDGLLCERPISFHNCDHIWVYILHGIGGSEGSGWSFLSSIIPIPTQTHRCIKECHR